MKEFYVQQNEKIETPFMQHKGLVLHTFDISEEGQNIEQWLATFEI